MWLIACWTLAMVSGLLWARRWTGLVTIATLLVFFGTQAASLLRWSGWLQLAVVTLTPWGLAWQRGQDEVLRAQRHAEEAKRMAQLSEAARAHLALQTSTREMETQIADITDLYHVTKETARTLHLPELFAASLNIAPRLLNARGLRFIDLSGETPHVWRASRGPDGRLVPLPVVAPASSPASGDAGNGKPSGDATQLLEMEQAVIKEVVLSGRPSSATARELSCPLPEGISRVSWAPLWRGQQPIGVLVADELDERQLKTLTIVANQLSLQFSRVHLYGQVEALAVTDALTGLSVRSHFLGRAREELARSKRHGLACSLLMTDFDLFKQKNDTFGHLVGDVVLRDVARLMQRNLREIDLIARYGGEEFILLLIETGLEQAMAIAQRLKQLIEVHPIHAYDEVLMQTVSIGVAEFPRHAQTLEALIDRADQALYAAKRAGRNRVIMWSEDVAK